MKKLRKIEQDQKSLISSTVQFLTASIKFLFLEGRLDTQIFLHPVGMFSENFLIKSLKSFWNS